eukprot:365377-Chlamydomonas_euryale.AAC.37
MQYACTGRGMKTPACQMVSGADGRATGRRRPAQPQLRLLDEGHCRRRRRRHTASCANLGDPSLIGCRMGCNATIDAIHLVLCQLASRARRRHGRLAARLVLASHRLAARWVPTHGGEALVYGRRVSANRCARRACKVAGQQDSGKFSGGAVQ